MFALRFFGTFIPFYPTLKGYSQSRTLDPAIKSIRVLSVVLKTGGNGCWLTAVACWHMRYLLRRISRRRHDRVSELCTNPESRTLFCIAWYHHRHTPSARAPSTRSSSPTIMPTPTPSHSRNDMARITRPVCTWVLRVLSEVGKEVLRQAQLVAAESASR
jgi:hypothetical protein